MSNKKYPSKYSNGKDVSAAQYITELICEKMAKRQKRDLHYRFWVSPEWEKYYRDQIASAHKLLKKYSDTAIVRALNNPRTEKIYSLRAPHLPPIIEQEQKKLESENQELSIHIERKDNISFGQKQNTRNIISKLKDLE
ncbi:MAG: hypothetical protein ACKO7N_06755 [Candidatus Nitrosotenuis sp.]